MINIRDISIRNKLILMQVFTSVIVLGIFIGVFIYTDIKDYKSRKVKSMQSLAHIISTNCSPTILFQDDDGAKEILAELRNGAPDVVHAVILDTSGRIFASYGRTNADSVKLADFSGINGYEFKGHSLFVSDVIISSDKKSEVLGKVVIEVELSELEAIKSSRYEMATILLLGAVAFSFLIAFVVQQ